MPPLRHHDPASAETTDSPQVPVPVTHVNLGEFSRDLFRGIRELHATHGPIGAIQDGSQRVVFLFSPEFNQQVLSDTQRYHARFFAVRGPKTSAQRRVTCGLLSMNGEQHRRNRRLVKEPFGRRAISTYSDTVTKLTDEMLAGWRVGDVRDVAEDMRKYMLRVTSTLLFGLDEPEMAYRLGDLIAEWVGMNDALGAGALVPDEVFSERYEDLLAFAEGLEREIMSMIRFRRESPKASDDVLSLLVRAHDEEGGLSDEELVGQATVLFSAAHMTTAHALSWTLFLLAEHPSVMSRLWAEWQTTPGELPPTVTHDDEGNEIEFLPLSLLERVIKESLRLLPASAYSQRFNNEAVALGPFQLPRGTGIVFTPLVTHHLPDIYAEPSRFLPDRWLTLRPSPYAYHPFGAGARMCIGGPLALAIIRIAVRKILTRFRLTVVPGSDVSAHVESTMLVPTGGVPMIVGPPDGQFVSSPVTGNIHELVELVEAPAAAPEVTPRKPR